jgi:ATP-dependent Clp protease ATP-binding subunit ClpA
MFERFTDRARRTIVVAQDEARDLGHPFIRPEHLALGLTKSEGLAGQALEEFGVTYAGARGRVLTAQPEGEARTGERLPFTPEAKKALEYSLREALRLKHSYIGTEHLLLGLLRLDERLAASVFHLDGEKLRTRVVQLAAGPQGERNRRSPALHTALGRAQGEAGDDPVTTGQLLVAIAADPESQGAKMLERAGVSQGALADALREVPVQGTSDATGSPRWFEIRIGGRTATVEDAELTSLLSKFSPEQIGQLLRRGMAGEVPPETAASTEAGD